MRILIFGATGMVGAGTLLECIADPRVDAVVVVGRRRSGITHPKVTELIHQDFFDLAPIASQFANCDACFFCLGVSSAGMKEDAYTYFTHDLTLAVAQAVARANPRLTFCYVSGAGTDSSEQGRVMWARVKGRAENAVLRLPFKAAFVLRPAYIQPKKGVHSSTPLYQWFYTVIGPAYPLVRLLAPGFVTTTVNLGRALIRLAVEGNTRKILETREINRLAAAEARG